RCTARWEVPDRSRAGRDRADQYRGLTGFVGPGAREQVDLPQHLQPHLRRAGMGATGELRCGARGDPRCRRGPEMLRSPRRSAGAPGTRAAPDRRRMRGKDVEKARKEVRRIAPGRGRYAVPLHCETFSLPVLDTSEGRGYFCSHSVTCMMTDSVHKERWAKRERQESSSARTHLQFADRDIQGMG